MPDSQKRRRSPMSTLLAVIAIAIALIVIAAMKVTSLFRPRVVAVEELKFPVLVFQPGGAAVFAEWDSTPLEKFEEGSTRTPVDGTVIVDSDFNQYVQEHVERKRDGDLTWLARRYLPLGLRVKYTFTLRPTKSADLEGLREMIAHAAPLSDDATEDATRRANALAKSTMADILAALHFEKPPDPPTATTYPDPPTTEQVEPTTQSDEKPPADPN